MLHTELINKVNCIYSLGGEVKFLSVVKKGFLSENYILKNKQQKFFLKKYRAFGLARLRETHAVKQFFFDKEIPVIMPIKTKNRKTFFAWNGNHYGLFPFVIGRQVSTEKLSDKEIESCAQLLAKIHLISKNKCPKLVKERGLGWDKEESLRKSVNILRLIKGKKIKSVFDKKVIKYLVQKIYFIKKNNVKYQDFRLKNNHLIHGDYHEDNIFFNKGGDIMGVFDWEKANQAPRVLELVRVMWFFCFYDKYNKSSFRRAQIFLKKYDELYPLDKNELEAGLKAWFLNQLHSMWVVDEIYLKNNKRVKILMNSYINFLNYQSKNLDRFINRILSSF